MCKKIGKIVVFLLCIAAIAASIMYYFHKKTKQEETATESNEPEDFHLDEDLKDPENREYIPLT